VVIWRISATKISLISTFIPRHHDFFTMSLRERKIILNFLIGALVLIFFLFSGCILSKPAENLSNPDTYESHSQPDLTVLRSTETTTVPNLNPATGKPSKYWYSDALAQNVTVSNQFGANESFEISIGDAFIQRNASLGSVPSHIFGINITAKNSGVVPIEVTFLTVGLHDKSDEGCSYDMMNWCDVLEWYQINPGESETKTLNVTFVSAKGYEELSSQKYILDGVINAESDTTGITNARHAWIIDLKIPQNRTDLSQMSSV
jgi:hypothetical protein